MNAPLMAGNDTGIDAGAYTGFACSPTTRRLGLTAGQLGEMRARRDAALPGVSMVALFSFALHQAFGRTGIRLSETVKIPFDVRRYLPRDKDTLGSFSAGLDFTLDRADKAQRRRLVLRQVAQRACAEHPVASFLGLGRTGADEHGGGDQAGLESGAFHRCLLCK